MKTRKATAFWTTLVVLVALFVIAAVTQQLSVVGGTIVIAIVSNAGVYVGGNVMDNWQRSKFYQPGLEGK